MHITIRNEEKADYRRVEEIARDAFWNLYTPGTDLHYVVNQMRNHIDFIKELSFVVEIDGIIEGAIFYTKAKIVTPENKSFDIISFGPVFLSPHLHRKGIGKKLISYSINKAKEMGYKVIATLGYPYHYEPYGFVGGKKYNISMPDGKFYKGLLVLPLYEDALNDVYGYAVFSESLEVDEKEAELFDKNFPHKEKKIQESQNEYEKACAELDE